MKQIKLIEGKTLEEANEKMNEFYVHLCKAGYKVVHTKRICDKPITIQMIYVIPDSEFKGGKDET